MDAAIPSNTRVSANARPWIPLASFEISAFPLQIADPLLLSSRGTETLGGIDQSKWASVSPAGLNSGQVIAVEIGSGALELHRRRRAIQYRPADGVGAAARAPSFP